jgi:multidrug efflux pump subunit AcrA (membrane-fusion protein)
MPGLLREVAVKVGQEVKAGEKLAVIEAMKMENILKAEQDCKVKKISAAAGESLMVDQVIIEFEWTLAGRISDRLPLSRSRKAGILVSRCLIQPVSTRPSSH